MIENSLWEGTGEERKKKKDEEKGRSSLEWATGTDETDASFLLCSLSSMNSQLLFTRA